MSHVDLGATYDEHRPLLIGTAMSRYGIGESDAEGLMHDVFLAFLVGRDEIRDARAWLISAMCNASKSYLRTQHRELEVSPDLADPSTTALTDTLPPELATRDCFACLTPRCKLALRLRYLEGYTPTEIADELRTTENYARKLVSKCLSQAQDRYGKSA